MGKKEWIKNTLQVIKHISVMPSIVKKKKRGIFHVKTSKAKELYSPHANILKYFKRFIFINC